MHCLDYKAYSIAIAHDPRIKNKLRRSLFEFFIDNSDNNNKTELMIGYNDKYITNIIDHLLAYPIESYKKIYSEICSRGIKQISVLDNDYPGRFKKRFKSRNLPFIIYIKGNLKILENETAAVVGSRDALDISMKFTRNICKKFADKGITVVSGYARGIDRCALYNILESGGSSVIVLPYGIFHFKDVALEKYIKSGKLLVLSTWLPKASWSSFFAVKRNEYIYGLSDSIYIPQTGREGGTWGGAMFGIKNGYKIYVRHPDLNENSYNHLLLLNKTVALDSKGRQTENMILKSVNNKLESILSENAFTITEIQNKVDYEIPLKRLKEIINDLQSINTLEKSGKKLYTTKNHIPGHEISPAKMKEVIDYLIRIQKPKKASEIKKNLDIDIGVRKLSDQLKACDKIECNTQKGARRFVVKNEIELFDRK